MEIEVLHNERELFSQLSLGDETAFTRVFHFYSRRLYPWLLKKTKEPAAAEEIMQDTFLKLWVNRERLAGIENREGYIYKIAANLILDHFRKLAMEHNILNRFQYSKAGAVEASTQSTVDLRETQKIIDQAVYQLPQQRKLIYTMRQKGMSYDEIAAQLGLSANTVRNQLISAGKFIRGYLMENGISSLALITFYTTL
ncbi:MAG: RNA polymerase sigma factor [Pseudobacter sp.]|uniref:RNA polymerase sigma factor n=1 Tax=Pseudobacter sp. TaxID=2045420 RepID=UPI003F7D0E66